MPILPFSLVISRDRERKILTCWKAGSIIGDRSGLYPITKDHLKSFALMMGSGGSRNLVHTFRLVTKHLVR
jgi:hypothetical protein